MSVYNLAAHPRYEQQRNLITRQQLMQMLAVKSVNTIKSYVKQGMPEERLPGGQPRYDPIECRAWLAQFRR